jgi:microcin C transport system permease protein
VSVNSAPLPSSTSPSTAPNLAPPLPAQGWLRLTPLNQRRLANFKANKRGYWSFWIFLILFVLSLFAEFIANDRPILARYKGEWLMPVIFTYEESKFGGFLAETDYRDKVIADEINAHGWMIWPPIRFADNSHNYDVPTPVPSKPTWALSDDICRVAAQKKLGTDDPKLGCQDIEWNWLGTDDQGRDVLARLIYGFRISILFGLILAAISSAIGILAGAVQGYFGGWIDLIFQRFIEIWSSLPTLYVLIILSSIITPSFFVLLAILLTFSWVALVHVVRAEFLRARNFEYVNAARALGLSNARIMWKHVLPNAMVATLTFMPFILNGSITTLTSLDFLGFGLPPGSPSLGELLLQGRANLNAPWLGITGFFVIAIMLSLLIFVGEAVRDAFDPRKSMG